MAHRLALALGCTVAELNERMSSAEFTEWCAYASMEPFGPRADDWRIAALISTIMNASGRWSRSFTPSDLLPKED